MKNGMLDVQNMLVTTMEEPRPEDLPPEQLENVVKRAEATLTAGNAIVGKPVSRTSFFTTSATRSQARR